MGKSPLSARITPPLVKMEWHLSRSKPSSLRSTSPIRRVPEESSSSISSARRESSSRSDDVAMAVPSHHADLADIGAPKILEDVTSKSLRVGPRNARRHGQFAFVTHSFRGDPDALTSFVKPWANPAFASLPPEINRQIGEISLLEMPKRQIFEEVLGDLLHRMSHDISDTAVIAPDTYAFISKSLRNGDLSKLPAKTREWLQLHHVQSGSNRFHLLLMPSDEFYRASDKQIELRRHETVSRMDDTVSSETNSAEERAYDVLPVQPQIYDTLVFAHQAHGSSSELVAEIRRIGVVRQPAFVCFAVLMSTLLGEHHLDDGRALRPNVPSLQPAIGSHRC